MIKGRYTACIDEPFAVFIIGMWLPLHKDPTVQLDQEIMLMVQIVPGSREGPRQQVSPGQSCTRVSQNCRSEIRARRRDGAQH